MPTLGRSRARSDGLQKPVGDGREVGGGQAENVGGVY